MAYFSNGIEAMDYASWHCDDCVHYPGCSVLLAHELYNYDECNKPDSILHLLIPRSEDKLCNEDCTMWHKRVKGDK
jgi:hypothetical protein